VPSIAERVENALATLFGHPVPIVAAGRTDAGVHATGQVISCTTSHDMATRRIAIAASALLRPGSIAVVRAIERPIGFSARRDARARTYRYRILNRPAPSPLWALRAFHVGASLDLPAMRTAALPLVGQHDFKAFCAAESRRKPTRRLIEDITISRDDAFVDIVVTADSFLHHMVRIVTGTLVEVGRGRRTPKQVEALLASGDRRRAGFTAPPHGLYLESVRYDDPV
jgi:tRNA pseudouridine38-40 synthase